MQDFDGGVCVNDYKVDIEEYYEISQSIKTIADSIQAETIGFMEAIETICGESDILKGQFATNVASINNQVKEMLNEELIELTSSVSRAISGADCSSFNYRIAESDHLEV